MRQPALQLFLVALLTLVACVPPHALREGGLRDSGATERVYTLAFGDTLWGVANLYNVPGGYPALARANHIPDPTFVLAGDKLRLTTMDTSLPLPPKLTAAPSISACAMQAVPARPSSLSGCREASCVDVGRGGSVCACSGATPAEDGLVFTKPGAAPVRIPVSSATPWWFDAETAPEPERSARTMVAARAQLDGDPALETVVSWRTQLSDVGMSQATALLVDDDGTPGAAFRADNFGVGSVVNAGDHNAGDHNAGDHCDVLATEWELTDEPARDFSGWYLGARRFAVDHGSLTPTHAPLVMRRLFTNFRPAATMLGSVRVGAPSIDLTSPTAFARSTEPSVELPTYQTQRGTLRSARRIDGHLVLDLDGVPTPVGVDTSGVRRLGDLSSGVLYPTDYSPADDRTLRCHPVEVRTYSTMWGETWSVVWVG